ncbi:MAG: hypothetical protein JSR37_03650 [Verrucomicrobia bacterium]|nr:hypothetical protein [Verrucomicrobiota bacterium]MBS0637151.1 hypothetical protein [Verrucomicrobiota bacterium]
MRITPIKLNITTLTEERKGRRKQKMPPSYRVRADIGLDGSYVVAVIKGRKNRFRYTRQFEQFIKSVQDQKRVKQKSS